MPRRKPAKKPKKPEPMRDEGDLLEGPIGVADANCDVAIIMGRGD